MTGRTEPVALPSRHSILTETRTREQVNCEVARDVEMPACVSCRGVAVVFKGRSLLPFMKNRASVRALNGVSFSVSGGEIFGLLGPNGSGKTTLLKVLSTIILPAKGKVTVGGYDIYTAADRVRGLVGLAAGSERSFNFRLTGEQNLRFFAAVQGLKPGEARRRIRVLLEYFGLEEAGGRAYMAYSTGMRRKLMIVRALLTDPPILLLDEPTSSLDPISARNLRDLIQDLNREGKTIILSTHYLPEAQELCRRVILLKDGRIIASGRPRDLVSSVGQADILSLVVRGFNDEVSEAVKSEVDGTLLKIEYIDRPLGSAELTFLHRDAQEDYLTSLVSTLANHGVKITRFSQKEPTLEDAFLQIAKDDRGGHRP